jgi:hypothetical protein
LNRRIFMEWPTLGLTAKATLADDKNPELCEEFWQALPFDSIMNNAVITDGSMYCWVPILSHAPIRKKERIDLAPVGQLRYSQNTGNKFIVQHSACNEDIYAAVLGQVDEEDINTVQSVGQRASAAIFMTKEELPIRVSRIGADKAQSLKPRLECPESCREEVSALAEELLELAFEASRAEPEEHKRVRTGKNAGMGSSGQYFSTWEFVYSLTRDLSMYTLYPMTRLCRDPLFDVRQLERIYLAIDPTYTNLLGSYGLVTLREKARVFRAMAEEQTLTLGEFTYLLDAFTLYTNMLAQWSYFYFPWGIGTSCFRFEDEYRVYKPQE